MRTVGERVALGGGLFGELLDVIDFEGEVGEVGPDHDRAAFVEFAELDFLLAPGSFQENELRAAARSMAPHFLQAEDVAIK